MTATTPETSDRVVTPDSGGSSRGPIDRLPGTKTRWRIIELTALSAGVTGAILCLELIKSWLHPDITVWESHFATVVFSAVAAAIAAYVILQRRDVLHNRILEGAVARQQAAESVASANALLLATLESNRDGVLVASLEGAILTFNRQFLDMWSMPESVLQGPTRELMRHAKAQLSTPERLSASVARLQTDVESESTDILEFKDGRTVELFSAPQRIDGVVVGRISRCRDVTTHRQAQRHIQMLAQTIRSTSECVSVTDMNDRIIFVNQAFLDTYGFDESDLIGKPVSVVRSNRNDAVVALQVFPETLKGGWRGELWNRKKDGTEFQIFLSTSVVRDEAGTPVALVGVARDITEQKHTDAALARGRESERIVTLAAGIAHEFNNLMQTVLASTGLALMELPPGSGAREPLQFIAHAGERAANLTSKLLAYAGRGVIVRIVSFDLNAAIGDHAEFLRTLMPPGTTFDLDLAPGGAPILADRQQIRHVLTGLVTNAAEAMMARTGHVRVRTRIEDITKSDQRPWVADERPTPGQYVLLSVEDEGVGMETETITHIFDPFFSTKFLGRGMGLPAVFGIVRAADGAIAVESTPDRGTSVTVAFPAHPTSLSS